MTPFRLRGPLLAMLLMFLPTPALAESNTPLLDRLLTAYEGVSSLSAGFTQETGFAGFSTRKRYGGTVDLVRPDRMRWDYSDGSNQQIYVVAQEVTLYAPDSKQAIVSTLSPTSDRQIPLHLLADVTGIADTYDVKVEAAGVLTLTPKTPHPQAPERIELGVHPESGLISRVTLHLHGGNTSNITFHEVRTNLDIADARFLFNPPDGVYVIHQNSFPKGKR
ncbi:MAG: outer membrane lipoprotein carrier protein LolA [Leptospirillia bacterium]